MKKLMKRTILIATMVIALACGPQTVRQAHAVCYIEMAYCGYPTESQANDAINIGMTDSPGQNIDYTLPHQIGISRDGTYFIEVTAKATQSGSLCTVLWVGTNVGTGPCSNPAHSAIAYVAEPISTSPEIDAPDTDLIEYKVTKRLRH